MEFNFGKSEWKDIHRGQEGCFLLTNRKGGYSALSRIDSLSRNEHNLLMACVKAPNNWVQMISKLEMEIKVTDQEYNLSAQEYTDSKKNQMGQNYLNHFSFDRFPRWSYLAGGVSLDRRIIMKHEENLVLVQFEMENRSGNDAKISLRPWMRFTPKGVMPQENQCYTVQEDKIESNGMVLYYKTDAELIQEKGTYISDLFFQDDEKDGRTSTGAVHRNHCLEYQLMAGEKRSGYVIYSLSEIMEDPKTILLDEESRQKRLFELSGMTSELGRQLTLACDQFVVDRESTKGQTIIAGYPFFGDWGRDTMIASLGCCIAAGRKDDAESIFNTFMKYIKKGIMPNMFPEGDEEPRYNTVDASLLFIYAVYEYYQEFKDLEFVKKAMPVMEDIIYWYKKGTDFNIKMDIDGLIQAGSGFDQVTWMDVRIDDVLPTPRHGKPVEINAYWYNDLKIMAFFSRLLGNKNAQVYEELSNQVKNSFIKLFWNEKEACLRDVVFGNKYDNQIRCNQIWAVSIPFGMLSREQEKKVVDKVFSHLYTPYGLRSLSPEDPEFKPNYGGSLWNRDNAYHQGTVWAFPLGGYYLAYLKVHNYSKEARFKVIKDMDQLKSTLREGCVGQIAEIFDGKNPTGSQGCFAQAWSVSELLRALKAAEKDSLIERT